MAERGRRASRADLSHKGRGELLLCDAARAPISEEVFFSLQCEGAYATARGCSSNVSISSVSTGLSRW